MLRVMANELSDEAKAFFKKQGSIGGKKRFAGTTRAERKALAKKAAKTRWNKAKKADKQ